MAQIDLIEFSINNLNIDECKVINNLTKDLSLVIKPLENKILDLNDNDPLKHSIQKLIKLLHQSISNKSLTINDENLNNTISPEFTQIINNIYPQQDLESLKKWFFLDENFKNENKVFYLIHSNFPKLIDFNSCFYHIFLNLKSINSPFSILCDFGYFDRNLLPKLQLILKNLDLTPSYISQKLIQILIINPCPTFMTYLLENQKSIYISKKIYFTRDLKSIH